MIIGLPKKLMKKQNLILSQSKIKLQVIILRVIIIQVIIIQVIITPVIIIVVIIINLKVKKI